MRGVAWIVFAAELDRDLLRVSERVRVSLRQCKSFYSLQVCDCRLGYLGDFENARSAAVCRRLFPDEWQCRYPSIGSQEPWTSEPEPWTKPLLVKPLNRRPSAEFPVRESENLEYTPLKRGIPDFKHRSL